MGDDGQLRNASFEIDVQPPEPGQTRAVDVGSTKVLLCNVDGRLYAVENQCTHAHVSLTHAKLAGGEIECPVHGARFDAQTGTAMCGPARRALRTFAVSNVDGVVRISLD